MKTVKSMMIGLVLFFASAITYAAPKTIHGNPTKEDAISTYLNAVVHGKLDGINNVIDDDAEFKITRGSSVTTLNKLQVLDALQSSANVEQDCECTKTVMQDDDQMNVSKVEMKYKDFTRTDVITSQHAGNGWKITKVETSYK